MTDLDWNELRLFLAVWRSRSLGGAGRKLGINVSTAARQLDALEARLGLTLFERARTGVTPTAAAEVLAPKVEQVERAIDSASRTVEGLEQAPVGEVRVTCLPGIAELVVVPLIATLMEVQPGLRVLLEVSTSVADLTRNEADLAIRPMRPTAGDLQARRLSEASWVLAATPAMARSLGTVHDLSKVPFISWTSRWSDASVVRWLRAAAPDAPVVFRTDSIGAQVAAAQAGIGAAFVVEPLIGARTSLVPVRLSAALTERHPFAREALWLVVHRALRRVPRIARTWDFFVERFSQLG